VVYIGMQRWLEGTDAGNKQIAEELVSLEFSASGSRGHHSCKGTCL